MLPKWDFGKRAVVGAGPYIARSPYLRSRRLAMTLTGNLYPVTNSSLLAPN